MTDVELNVKGLDQLLKALGGKQPVARVGILGAQARSPAARTIAGYGATVPTNAQVGAWHEFGTTKLPVRSFLRVPISDNLQKEMESAGALDKDVLAQVVASGTVVPWLKKIAVLAEGIVADAFDSGGFGKWKPSNITRKKVHQTLVETQQLRNSITSEVKE